MFYDDAQYKSAFYLLTYYKNNIFFVPRPFFRAIWVSRSQIHKSKPILYAGTLISRTTFAVAVVLLVFIIPVILYRGIMLMF